MLTIYNRLNEGKETQSIIARMSIDINIIYSMQSLNIYIVSTEQANSSDKCVKTLKQCSSSHSRQNSSRNLKNGNIT